MNKLFAIPPLRWLPAKWRPQFDGNQNLLQFLALCLLWDAVLALLIVSASRIGTVTWPVVWDWISMAMTIIGTLWIASGVFYTKPGNEPFDSVTDLSNHVTETFAYASRTCVFGVVMILAGFIAQACSKLLAG